MVVRRVAIELCYSTSGLGWLAALSHDESMAEIE